VAGGDIVWVDGPLTRAMREGAVCYLDEVIEARRDTLAVLHSVADHRRTLYLDRTNETVPAHAEFFLICSYNPRRLGAFKQMAPSLRQRFATLELDYLAPEREALVVERESGVTRAVAEELVGAARALRTAEDAGVKEQPSTRSLVNAGRLVAAGAALGTAIEICLIAPLELGAATQTAVRELLAASGA
jgi:MoxR-like ATPase